MIARTLFRPSGDRKPGTDAARMELIRVAVTTAAKELSDEIPETI